MAGAYSAPYSCYGIDDICLSLPSVVGRGGVERVLRLNLSTGEAQALRHSADVLKGALAQIKLS